MITAIEILQLGPSANLFQICDGERFGVVEFQEGDGAGRIERMQRPHVLKYFEHWLADHGAFTGSQQPPYLPWIQVEMAVIAARAA